MPTENRDRPPRVLVVDDSRDQADSLALLLRLWGHTPLVAYDAPAALDLARKQGPDVVLLDIGLPGLDGCELARRLRQLPGCDHALLVAVTGHGREEDVRRCKDAGIDRHFTKPADPDEVERLLAEATRLVPAWRRTAC